MRVIELTRPPRSRSLGTASKLNRDPGFLRELIDHGEARAEQFLAALAFEDAWRRGDPAAVLACFAADAELVSAPPFPDWTVRTHRDDSGAGVQGRAEAELRAGAVTALRLGG
jgi:hypothetical protein